MAEDAGLVLDTPALTAYSRGLPLVGEQIADMADRSQRVLVPALCLAIAYRDAASEAWPMIDILVDLPHVQVSPMEGDMCAVMGGWSRTVSMDLAQAMIESATHATVPILTDRRKQITTILAKEWPIIDL
ncbi:hypothetical protein [Asanoa siamensis]|uniref:PIN domain-containing protein n=1 Tax=Asanoa siamensis TaxID=926357 RepID=A0ABQ4CI45_9ACTN|nr:hypothetical protein [Asanoa siamensis]GIF70931.1 hypothetical protein Asi02nite_04490 [Asanoa siamensis]